MIRYLLALMLMLLPCVVSAQWYLGQASIPYDGDNYNDVRKKAVELAIENASLQAQSFISIETTVTGGILTKSESSISSAQQISEIVILNESIAAGKLTVNLKVNMHSSANCIKDHYLKQLVVAQFPLLTPAQAAAGDISKLPFHVASRFKSELSNQPNIFVEGLISQMVYKPQSSFDSVDLKSVKAISHGLNSDFQSQYLVFGYIRDVSLYNEITSSLLVNTKTPKRNFTIKVFMYDRISDSILVEEEYHGEGDWSFDSNGNVDLSNSLFWRSNYGQAVVNTLFKVAQDINRKLSCEPTKAIVINTENNFVTINIGKLHGVKKGDVFQHTKLRNIKLPNSMLSTFMPAEKPIHLEVVQVSNKVSLLKTRVDDLQWANQHQIDLYDAVTSVSF
ncbi:flagellar assembly protein T N-terminal domain-containing protein [Shewanella intestini]|uniref:Flagellar assembly protein T N-terminal domain-containing protein n=1 Tax=Shewanella intestini TaxID=2017544 RepID=A0ABS5I1W7_9GAMM|nr:MULTISPECIES: flagellar assembly protein T N-terminal domain-containing protein [Shewanella]MBR9728023.1 hypothetical protein [Shewanella intestini]MRG36426.1 hypothetical protein [Shewanella sp. XMDDZSB0408]